MVLFNKLAMNVHSIVNTNEILHSLLYFMESKTQRYIFFKLISVES